MSGRAPHVCVCMRMCVCLKAGGMRGTGLVLGRAWGCFCLAMGVGAVQASAFQAVVSKWSVIPRLHCLCL